MYTNRIFFIREENDIKQKDLANILNISQSLISRWESGTDIPSIKRINILSNYYKISLDYIFNFTNKKSYNNSTYKEIDKVIVGKRLQSIRKKYNLTLRSLATELNTTSSTLSAYESGKTLVLTAFAIQICKKYNISLDWLYGKIN